MSRIVRQGDRVGPYLLGAHLGSGGVSDVFDAQAVDGHVALKVLRISTTDRDDLRSLFERELRAGRRVDSSRVARPVHWDLHDDPPWIAFQPIQGTTLDRRLANMPGRSLSYGQLLSVFLDVTKGLCAVHDAGITAHRDVKPSNIMVTPQHEAFLLDLGVAVLGEGSDITRNGWGTSGYRSPEQQYSSGVSPKSDVWSFGVCLLEAATGVTPFGVPGARDYRDQLEGFPNCLGTPDGLAQLAVRCLSFDPALRPTARQALGVLERLQKGYARIGGNVADRMSPPVLTRLTDDPFRITLVEERGQAHLVIALHPTPVPGTDRVVTTAEVGPLATLGVPGFGLPTPGNYAWLNANRDGVDSLHESDDFVPVVNMGDGLPLPCPACGDSLVRPASGSARDLLCENFGCPARVAGRLATIRSELASAHLVEYQAQGFKSALLELAKLGVVTGLSSFLNADVSEHSWLTDTQAEDLRAFQDALVRAPEAALCEALQRGFRDNDAVKYRASMRELAHFADRPREVPPRPSERSPEDVIWTRLKRLQVDGPTLLELDVLRQQAARG